ncbi:MAG: diadenylate cyclase CdaA [Christensenellales bacterium]
MQQIWNSIMSSIETIGWRDLVDVTIIAVIIYQLLVWTSKTRAIQVLKGLGVLILAAWVSEFLRLQTLNWLLNYIINAGALVMVVLFQPELRRMLEQIGQGKFLKKTGLLTLTHEGDAQDLSWVAEELSSALVDLSQQRIGALVVVEQENVMEEIIRSGTLVDAKISSSLIANIFYPNTPLHDGAVLIRGGRIVAAGCLLPLSQRTDIDQSFGTRHRAALGISELSDCVTFVVSEETGFISIARGGRIQHNVTRQALVQECETLFGEPEKKTSRLTQWVKMGKGR